MSTPLFWLPALPEIATARLPEVGSAGTELLIPQLTPDLLRRQLTALTAARETGLADRPVREIVGVIDAVAARFLDSADSLRLEALRLLPAVTGYSEAMCMRILDRMASDWRADRLERLLAEDLGGSDVLDGFAPRIGSARRTYAVGPALTVHFFSGNVPGVAVTSLVRALLVKSASLGKAAAGEPVLPALFARGIAETDEAIGRCLAVAYWPGGTEELESVALASPEVVIAYGSSNTIADIRRRLPAGRKLLEYGGRISFGVVGREALSGSTAAETATDAANAVATFDQQGCVSPHLIYVQEGGEITPERWAEALARAMDEIEIELPRGRIDEGGSAAIQQLRGQAELSELAGSGVRLHRSDAGTEWTVIYDRRRGFEASCLNRVVRVKPFSDPDSIVDDLAPLAGLLQTVGLAGDGARLEPLATRLARMGVSRLAPLREVAWPPPWWHHDGRPPLGDLVHWCDWD